MNKLIATLLFVIPSYVNACLLHGTLDLPKVNGTIEVNIATNIAMQDAKITPFKLEVGDAGVRQVQWWLRMLSPMLDEYQHSDVFVYVSDISLWAKLGTTIEMEALPDENSTTIIVHRQALQAIISNNLTLNQALRLNAVKIFPQG